MKSRFLPLLLLAALPLACQTGGPAGTAAPELSAVDAQGHPFRLDDFRGRPVLVDFWATWCPPCRAEVPVLVDIHRRFRDKGLVIVSVSLDTDMAAARRYIGEHGMDWIQVLDRQAADAAADRWGVEAIPAIFLLDRQGRISQRDLRGEELVKAVAEMTR